MARKICAKLILELRESGLSVNQIAQTRHISKHSVSILSMYMRIGKMRSGLM